MNFIYFSMFIVTFIPSLTPVCSNLNTYPRIMYLVNILFLVNACFFWFMYIKNFFFDLSETYYYKSELTEPQEVTEGYQGGKTHNDTLKLIFKDQMSSYNCFTILLSMIQIVVMFLGVIFVGKSQYLACTKVGWTYQSLAGEGFILSVLVNMIMQCFLVEKILHWIPQEHSYFEEENDNFKMA